MAFNINKKKTPIADINVTPLVDVMLVLLVIFMMTAPLMLNGIKLTLPRTKEVNRINLNTSQVVLSLTRTGEYYVGKEKYLKEELISIITKKLSETVSDTIYIRADFGIRYGRVARMMSHLKRSGLIKIALVTETDEK